MHNYTGIELQPGVHNKNSKTLAATMHYTFQYTAERAGSGRYHIAMVRIIRSS